MSHRILKYESDGEERFAVWSTVVDDWIVYDMTEDELIEWHLGREARLAHDHITTRIEQLRGGYNPYQHWSPEKKRARLKEMISDD